MGTANPPKDLSADPAAKFAVEFLGVSKRFGDCISLAGVSFSIERGTIHAIVGENGAGKSTAMNLLYGMHPPNAGEIRVDGKPVHFRNSEEAIHAGIGMVHQHFMLSPPHSVLDNVILGAEPGPRFMPIRRAEARKEILEICRRVAFTLDPDAKVGTLSVGAEQRVEILKALYRKARILILDEPTAVLTPQEVRELAANLRQMRDAGMTIILITHKLKEVLELADAITVFRHGQVTGAFSRGELSVGTVTVDVLAEAMVGRKVRLPENTGAPNAAATDAAPAFELPGTFRIARGEILGIAGVEGNGQGELVRAILGIGESDFTQSGDARLEGRSLLGVSVAERIAAGIACIPENRHVEAVALDFDVTENFMLGQTEKYGTGPTLRWSDCRVDLAPWVRAFEIRPADPDLPLRSFSGGNQQKWVVARELARKPKLLIAAQPTRGVDIGAIEKIHGRLLAERDAGMSILLISSELDEILKLSDRILVLYGGKIVGEHRRGEVNELQLGAQMGGHTASASTPSPKASPA